MLALRIDFLNGIYHAADPTAHSTPEWPPHPDRVFQALVAAAYGVGLDPSPLRALEGQAPEITFGEALAVQGATLYVPAAYVANEGRVRKYDPFMADITDPLYLFWPLAPAELREPLGAIAAGVTYLGRAKTPVAVSLASEVPGLPHRLVAEEEGELLLRVPQPGRLDELDAAFAVGRRAGVAGMVGYSDRVGRVPASPWGELLPLRPDRFLDLRRTAQLAEALRGAVLSRAGDGASPLLHGHGGDHAAWAVLPDVGHTNARGRVLGLGLWLPRGIDEEARAACVLPLLQVDHVRLGEQRIEVRIPPGHQPTPYGLRRRTWSHPARTWVSVTPLVLDRHPKRGQPLEELVADSVEMAGHPRPAAVTLGQCSPLRGVPVAREFRPRSRGRWTHVALHFAGPVAGPLLLGRDRHFGMGLMRPWER